MARVLTQSYEVIEASSIKPHPKNPRRGKVTEIAESIDENGFYGACIVQRSTGYILVGNHRWMAAQQDGLGLVPVIWLDVDDKQAKKIMAADNASSDHATYDEKSLAKLLQDIELDDKHLRGTGYKTTDLDALIRKVSAVNEPMEDYDLGDVQYEGEQADLFEAEASMADIANKQGYTPEEKLAMYNQNTLRQIMLVMSIDEFNWALVLLEALRTEHSLGSNTDAILFLLKKYEAARAKKEQKHAGTGSAPADGA